MKNQKILLMCIVLFSTIFANSQILVDAIKTEKNGTKSAVVRYSRCDELPVLAFKVLKKTVQIGFSSSVKAIEVVENPDVGQLKDCKGPSQERSVKINLGALEENVYLVNPLKLK